MKLSKKRIKNILLCFCVMTLIFSSCSSTKNINDQAEPKETYNIGKYAGVPLQYRAILQEQEEKNARLKEQQNESEQEEEYSNE